MKEKFYSTSLRGAFGDQREPNATKQSVAGKTRIASSNIPRLSPRNVLLAMTVLSAAIAFNFTGCDNTIQSNYTEQLVVDGIIYANEPVDSIVLHRTTPFGEYYDDLDYAIDGATVTITVDGVPHTLLPTGMKGRYYLPANDLIVQGGKTYNLSVSAPDAQTGGTIVATATTTVPMPIHFSAIEDSARGKTFILDTNNLAAFTFLAAAGPVDTSTRRYLLSVQALDTSYGLIRHRNEVDSLATIRYTRLPATAPAIVVTPDLFTWYGPNLITFYAIDTNWVDYQRQVVGGGAGTNFEPTLNHINGGIGLFGSAARDTVTIFVKPKS